MHGGGVEFALDRNVGLGEARLDIAHHVAEMLRDVAHAAGLLAKFLGFEILVQNGRALSHGFGSRERARQHFVIDFDQAGGFFGDMDAGGGNGGNRMPPIEHFALGEHVAARIAEGRVAFAQVDQALRHLRKIVCCHDRFDSGERRGLAGIDAANARMRVRAAQNEAVEQPGHLKIRAVERATCDLVGAIVPDRARTDDSVFLGLHALASWAACSTARMILS